MISELLFMNGYGLYVWSAFAFTLFCFVSLYAITKIQFVKEKKKFIAKYGALNPKRASFAKSQGTIKEILSNTSNI
tara:strand:- start:814 stop:1041 length:228 start_codon:yes stop_codon:yes gene_type:complete